MQKATRAALISCAAAALVTLPGLWSGTLWDNSETTYGEVAREIVLRGDWIVMHQNNAAWFVQPPLYFWIGAIFIKILGLTAFALRLPSALATIVMGGVVAYVVARRSGERAGIYCGLILSTCLLQAVVGRLAIMDALLDVCVSLTILWWYSAFQNGRTLPFVAGWIACAFGVLAKGPVAPAISFLAIGGFLLWELRFRDIVWPRAMAWLAGIAAFLVLVAPWFIELAQRAGGASIVTLIGYYTVGRYTGTIENQSGPFWYYVPAIILGFFPWIAYLPMAVRFAWQRAKAPPNSLLRLSLMWALLPFLFFSFAKTKLPNYIALEMPALAAMVALYADDAVNYARSRSLLISTASLPICITLIGVAIGVFTRQNRLGVGLGALRHDLVFLGVALLAGALASFLLLWSGKPQQRESSPYALAGAMVAMTALLGLLMLPEAEALKPVPHLAKIINAQSRPGDKIAIMNVAGGNALMFYTHPGIFILRTPGDADRAICTGSARTFLIVKKGAYVPQRRMAPGVVASWTTDNLLLYTHPCRASRNG